MFSFDDVIMSMSLYPLRVLLVMTGTKLKSEVHTATRFSWTLYVLVWLNIFRTGQYSHPTFFKSHFQMYFPELMYCNWNFMEIDFHAQYLAFYQIVSYRRTVHQHTYLSPCLNVWLYITYHCTFVIVPSTHLSQVFIIIAVDDLATTRARAYSKHVSNNFFSTFLSQ